MEVEVFLNGEKKVCEQSAIWKLLALHVAETEGYHKNRIKVHVQRPFREQLLSLWVVLVPCGMLTFH
jgi:hypothetical protein